MLHDICATPISPSCCRRNGGRGRRASATETTIGPYVAARFLPLSTPCATASRRQDLLPGASGFDRRLHDAARSCAGCEVFYDRFFGQPVQALVRCRTARRSARSPSPRGDWRMPSDASNALWRRELDEIATNIATAQKRCAARRADSSRRARARRSGQLGKYDAAHSQNGCTRTDPCSVPHARQESASSSWRTDR